MSIDLSKLSAPFPAEDIEWRVARAGVGGKGIYCRVLAYITNRAIMSRLDDVCGPENWRNEEPRILTINGKAAFAVGISIRLPVDHDQASEFPGAAFEWITKWDTAEPTNIEPAKGGFSGAMKRAGAQWGIGRYLYSLDEAFAEVSENDPGVRGWHYAKLPKEGGSYYWKEPTLPGWALPKEKESEVNKDDLNKLKRAWKDKFAPDSRDPKSLSDGFTRFVESLCGNFPINEFTCWTREAWDKCMKSIRETTDANGISSDVPFTE